jgi:TRAP-type mannitol/chloroaromatic compound transport system permease small subunit
MSLVKLIEFLRARLPSVIRWCIAALVLLVVIDAIPAIVDKQSAHSSAERLPAFWGIFGFIACVAIVYVSKFYGSLGINRKEDYYDE